MDRTDVTNLLKRFLFPARWPFIGHWFDYWVRYPAESFCASALLLVTTVTYWVIASSIAGITSRTSMIGTMVGLVLTFTLFLIGTIVIVSREREIAQRRAESKKSPVGG